MATRPRGGWSITNHAVARYRQRAVMCCERARSDLQLRLAMERELDFFASLYLKGGIRLVRCGPSWRVSNKFKNVCENPTHTFVVVDGDVVTTLGYGMFPTEAAQRAYAREARARRWDRYEDARSHRDAAMALQKSIR